MSASRPPEADIQVPVLAALDNHSNRSWRYTSESCTGRIATEYSHELEQLGGSRIRLQREISMLMTRERRPATRTLRGWAISVLQEAGAIRECEEHGWMQDRADPHARERAFGVACKNPPAGRSAQRASEAIAEVLDSIGDTCPECLPE